MNEKRLGFFTTSGLLAALATVLIVVGVGWIWGGVLFSPGGLSTKAGAPLDGVSSHAELSGRCSSCHPAFWEQASMADRCMACHTDVSAQLSDPASLHGLYLAGNPGLTCRSCHSDHNGANASLTKAIPVNFPHDSLGFALTAHPQKSDGSAFACADCHGQSFSGKFDQTVCATCHQQIKPDFMPAHLQAYGQNCLGCHDGVDSYGHAFDHSRVTFQLTGKHAGLDCGQCHNGARSISDMKNTSQDCGTCHAKDDAHSGRFGANCGGCHNTTGWTPASFDHNLASFKLVGKHVSAPCTSCHVNNVFKGTPSDCYSCHAKDDKHTGQFGKACDLCHTPDGWLPAHFDHSKFPLTGGHAGLSCNSCHASGVYAGLSTACANCHADPAFHKGLFGLNCAQCHTTSNWNATYTGPHPSCGEGGNCIGHGGASCRDCHTVNLMTATCTKCHDSNNPGGDGGGGGGGGGGGEVIGNLKYP